MPIGFCCSKCNLYNEEHTCLKTKNKPLNHQKDSESVEAIEPVSTSIDGGLLKVVIKKKDDKIPIYIDLQKHLE